MRCACAQPGARSTGALGAELAWTLGDPRPLLHTPLPFSPTHPVTPWVLRALDVLGQAGRALLGARCELSP